ncbi:MAG TPA: biotin carboxylase N-terminal domain-containing protein [Candidatus Limnocylindria bacterium]|nr:biotin carboxylase N-terminal domain-containing protein [Candidatus Limnocylindria bacterium]
MRNDTPAPPFERLLVANRGEIAIRVIRACRELGISPIAVHSDVDADALHVRLADRGEQIGPASAAESYLRIEAVVDAALRSGAEAVHPGYGFLSENAAFAEAVESAGLTFVGPPASALQALGNKLAARRSAEAAGVPIVPGTTVALGDDPASVEAVGLPVMLKAAAGGGGRGMRRVDRIEDLKDAMAAAQREATAAFGDGTIYVERVVSPARHVEVQLLGDRHGGLAVLGERDCSVQRRHQKLVEESPSPAVDPATREALFESARRVARTVDFHNAATVEFLLDAGGSHYFLEMNTRLQVEHGVTELVTGLDLVGWQIRVAAGERLPPEVLDAPLHGHAIEVRVYAEDPYAGFRPTSGRVGAWVMPSGPGVRVDAGIEADTDLRPEYDPLLAKLMVHADDREAAIARLRRALDETHVGGLQTDLGFLRWLLEDDAFASGRYDTGLIAERWGAGPALIDDDAALAAAAAVAARELGPARTAAPGTVDRGSAWGRQARIEALRR